MKLFKLILIGLFCTTSNVTHAMVNIFACEPEWGALAKEIGGSKVKIFSATHAKQDPHYIRARPSLLLKLGKLILFFVLALVWKWDGYLYYCKNLDRVFNQEWKDI